MYIYTWFFRKWLENHTKYSTYISCVVSRNSLDMMLCSLWDFSLGQDKQISQYKNGSKVNIFLSVCMHFYNKNS